jgi:hypothetical protein
MSKVDNKRIQIIWHDAEEEQLELERYERLDAIDRFKNLVMMLKCCNVEKKVLLNYINKTYK